MVTKLSEKEFDSVISSSQKPILIDFYADWCMPCSKQSPIIDELANELSDKVDFYKINVDENNELSSKLNISSIPTLLVYFGGVMKDMFVGLSSKSDISEILIKYL